MVTQTFTCSVTVETGFFRRESFGKGELRIYERFSYDPKTVDLNKMLMDRS